MAKILLVEDDPNIRMAAEFALSDAGHSIVACDNGTDGFASALSIEPDLILLDLMLPGMSGHDFLPIFGDRCFPFNPEQAQLKNWGI